MKLYLSSYRFGDHIDHLLSLVEGNRRVAVIENATDNVPLQERIHKAENKFDVFKAFRSLGFDPYPFDLRKYFQDPKNIKGDLRKFGLIWACGGNVFLLRRAMKQSGFDVTLPELLMEGTVAYGGWSAGVCVLGPTLRGLDLCDPPQETSEGYNSDTIWDGLGIIDDVIAPHYRSEHPEAAMIENVVAYLKQHNIPHKTMRDGDVILYKEKSPLLLLKEDGLPDAINQDKG